MQQNSDDKLGPFIIISGVKIRKQFRFLTKSQHDFSGLILFIYVFVMWCVCILLNLVLSILQYLVTEYQLFKWEAVKKNYGL